jgi:hypothetical protein
MRTGRYRIFTALVPGMATGYAQHGQIKPLYNTVDSDGFLRVGRTTGIKAAIVAHEWAKTGLVAGDNKNQQTTH